MRIMLMNELVSIVMPSYNTSKFIAESIESVLAQTYENWELIIVDDCSSDTTEDVVKSYLKDERIIFLQNKKNCGAAISRNIAIQKAKGKWIAFLDSDDLWLPQKLEKQIRFMKENKLNFTYTKYIEITEEGNESGITVSGPKKIDKFKMHLFNYVGCLTVIYNADYIGKIQIPDLKKRNDWAMWLLAIKKSNCYLFNESLSKYRVRKSGSITHVKGGKISLLKYHYILFRKIENMNPVLALFWTILNLPAGYMKRKKYAKNDK